MIPEQTARQTHTWWLEPRDPLVFGDGSRTAALAPRHRYLLPPQGTFSGMVRTSFVAGQAEVSREEARRLLEIVVRGPWLARRRRQGEAPELWLPVAGDVMAGAGGAPLPGELLDLDDEEGILWPAQVQPFRSLVHRADRLAGGTKTSALEFPYWPLADVVRWALWPGSLSPPVARRPCPISPEYRVHVGIDDESWTAEPEALFSSAGLRYDAEFGVAAEVSDGCGLPDGAGPSPETPPHLLVLGAEARTGACTVQEGLCFPDFDGAAVSWRDGPETSLDRAGAGIKAAEPNGPVRETFRGLYRRRLEELGEAGQRIGLRVQLLTPGAFGGWEPRWPSELQGKVVAVAMERHVAVSGWDLQARGPRSVRRLVPAGTVYYLDLGAEAGDAAAPKRILELCAAWWGRSLCAGQEGSGDTLAPPAHDGYGQILPAPFGISRSQR